MKMLLVLLVCVMLLFCGCAKVDDNADATPPITDSTASSETTESENGDISSGEPELENSAGEENVTTGDSESVRCFLNDRYSIPPAELVLCGWYF